MKKQWKSILAGTLACASLFLTACGGGTGGGPSGGNTLKTIDKPWWKTTGELSKNTDGSINFENVNLRLVTVVAGADQYPLGDIIEKFNQEHQGKINVNMEVVNEEDYATQIATRIQTNMNTPDLLMTHSKLQKGLVDKEYIQPLEEVITETGYEMDWDNYSDVFAKDANLGYKDATFIVPIDMQSEVVIYNKQMLTELGKSVPTTREEFLDVCAAFDARYTASDMHAVLMPTEGGHFHKYVYPTAYLQNGGELYDEKTNKANWTSDANIQAFKDANDSILDLEKAGYLKLNETEDNAILRFCEKKGLFLFISPWRVVSGGASVFNSYADRNGINKGSADFMNRMCEVAGGMSIARLFAMDSEKASAEYVYVDSHSFSISTSVEDINTKAACLYFMKWFTENGETAATWAQAGHNSCNTVALTDPLYTGSIFVQAISQNFYDANAIKTVGCNPYAGDLMKHLNGLSPKLLAKPTTLEAEVAATQSKYNGQIEFDEAY